MHKSRLQLWVVGGAGAWGEHISAARACRAPGPPVPGLEVIGLPCPPSSRPPDRGRRCLAFSAPHQLAAACCAPPCAPFFRERRAVEPRPHVCAKLYSLVHAFVLYCRSLWVCSRSAEHVVLAATQTAANKKMRAAAAQSEASFMPAHSSQNHVHCNIFLNSWPLRCGPRGRNSD